MTGYYDDHPLVVLDRHLALTGLVTPDTRQLGRRLAALHGVPFYDLERLVEHQAGRAARAIVFEDGDEAYCDLENEVLWGVLEARPFGIVALTDGALFSPELRRAVAEAATVVALERDLANSYWRFLALARAHPEDTWHLCRFEALTSIEQVRPLWEAYRSTLDHVHHRVSLDGRSLAVSLEETAAFLRQNGTPTAPGL